MFKTLPKLAHGTLAERSSDALLTLIRDEKLQPGAVLPAEARLAEGLGVSRPVIREALRMLAGLGVISIMNGKGAVVRALDGSALQCYFFRVMQMTEHATRDIMEVRLGVEREAASLAALRRTDDQMVAMRNVLEDMARSLGDTRRYARFDRELHLTIAQASGNGVMIQIAQSIGLALEQVSIAGMTVRSEQGSIEDVQRMHEDVVDAIGAQDAERAGRAMQIHMESAMAVLQARSATVM